MQFGPECETLFAVLVLGKPQNRFRRTFVLEESDKSRRFILCEHNEAGARLACDLDQLFEMSNELILDRSGLGLASKLVYVSTKSLPSGACMS